MLRDHSTDNQATPIRTRPLCNVAVYSTTARFQVEPYLPSSRRHDGLVDRSTNIGWRVFNTKRAFKWGFYTTSYSIQWGVTPKRDSDLPYQRPQDFTLSLTIGPRRPISGKYDVGGMLVNSVALANATAALSNHRLFPLVTILCSSSNLEAAFQSTFLGEDRSSARSCGGKSRTATCRGRPITYRLALSGVSPHTSKQVYDVA